ncbi:urease accessory protein UreD [Rhizobacter sp. Root404]|uniref:urease accessory protein UreD n=1 Tax=Rhizobacter sp. Root404 TaxID=1736528 RepID=UPI0006F4E77C|nr:urease accessory protein UreD [Rhizobacter sp. Root404]KQW38180.1 urease accessory protein ureD [Rhizobacter sp. Root404]
MAHWQGALTLAYRRDELRGAPRTVLHDRHDGPLRVLASLYPEGDSICHNVLVHPPGGLVGGDALTITLTLGDDAHALITTPGATRFYRSTGAPATQALHATVAAGARLEWLPLETIAYSGCIAENLMRFDLAPGAEMIGWDLLALGLPNADQPFVRGRFTQSLALPRRWLERGVIDAADSLLLDSPLGWAGHRVLGTVWFAAGGALAAPRREALLEAARAAASADPLAAHAGATAVHDGIVVLRVLAPRVEPAMTLLTRIRAAWRELAWQLPATTPRVWRT